jgi:hypothetical protein
MMPEAASVGGPRHRILQTATATYHHVAAAPGRPCAGIGSIRARSRRVHEALRTTPAVALGIADRVWSVGDLIDAALATLPIEPTATAPQRRHRFKVIDGGKV